MRMTTDVAEVKHLIDMNDQRWKLQTGWVRLVMKSGDTHTGLIVAERAHNTGTAIPSAYGGDITLNIGGTIDKNGFVNGGQAQTFDLLDVERIEPAGMRTN